MIVPSAWAPKLPTKGPPPGAGVVVVWGIVTVVGREELLLIVREDRETAEGIRSSRRGDGAGAGRGPVEADLVAFRLRRVDQAPVAADRGVRLPIFAPRRGSSHACSFVVVAGVLHLLVLRPATDLGPFPPERALEVHPPIDVFDLLSPPPNIPHDEARLLPELSRNIGEGDALPQRGPAPRLLEDRRPVGFGHDPALLVDDFHLGESGVLDLAALDFLLERAPLGEGLGDRRGGCCRGGANGFGEGAVGQVAEGADVDEA